MPRTHGPYDLAAAGGIALAIAVFGLITYTAMNAPPIEEQAHDYLMALYGEVPRFTCAKADSDGDGYVSCTVNVDGRPEPFECNLFGTGCRVPKARVGVR